jgi:uncharacterized protein (TIGR02246 family)
MMLHFGMSRMVSAFAKIEERFLAPKKHSERKRRASPGMTGGRRMLLVLPLLALFAGQAKAQAVPSLESIQSQAELDRVITALDAALFDAYNRCDLEKFASFFVDDVEFYHDQGGVTLGREKLTESVKKNICGKTTRELVPGTLQVYYMKGYGAIEMGVHRFHHPGHEDTEGVGEGRFIHLWRYQDGAWKITRVMSYDHHAAAK